MATNQERRLIERIRYMYIFMYIHCTHSVSSLSNALNICSDGVKLFNGCEVGHETSLGGLEGGLRLASGLEDARSGCRY